MKKHPVSTERPNLTQSDLDFVKEKIWNQFDHPDLLTSDDELIGIASRLGLDELVKEMKNEMHPRKGWKIHRNNDKK